MHSINRITHVSVRVRMMLTDRAVVDGLTAMEQPIAGRANVRVCSIWKLECDSHDHTHIEKTHTHIRHNEILSM